MTPSKMDRLAIVRDLLEISKPLKEIAAQLATVGWDYEGNEIEMTGKHLARALRRYVQNELSNSEIEFWANQIEGREDIYFDKQIADILYELANPSLTQSLDYSRARVLLEKLGF